MSYKIKSTLSVIFVGLAVTIMCACQNEPADNSQSSYAAQTDNPQSSHIIESGVIGDDEITYQKDMGGYSLNVYLPISKCDELENFYDVEIKEDNVYIADSERNKVSGITLNNPFVGGTHPGLGDLNVKFEVIEMKSGNLFAVRFPANLKNVPSACSVSLYYFDEGFVNYIGKQEGGGNFFPLITGDIQTDGDDFTLTETDEAGNTSQVTYSVDFEKRVLGVK